MKVPILQQQQQQQRQSVLQIARRMRRLCLPRHNVRSIFSIVFITMMCVMAGIIRNPITIVDEEETVIAVVSAFTSSSSSSSSVSSLWSPVRRSQQHPNSLLLLQQQRLPRFVVFNRNDRCLAHHHCHHGQQQQQKNHYPTTRISTLHAARYVSSSQVVLYSFFQNKNNPDTVTERTENDIDNDNYNDDNDDNSVMFENDPRDQWYVSSMTTTMVGAQAAFIPIGVVLATMMGIDLNFVPFRSLSHEDSQWLLWGILSTIPLVIFAIVLDAIEDQVPALQEVSDATLRSVYNLLGGSFKPLLALLTAVVLGTVAGVGEEILFRGILQEIIYQQQWMTTNYNTILSISLSSVIFGLFHAVTPMYVVLATIASVYFGTLYVLCNGDLTIPILCHSIYDIGALLYAHYTISQLPFPKLQQLIVGGDSSETSNASRPAK